MSHEMIQANKNIGDGGGMTVFKVKRDSETDTLIGYHTFLTHWDVYLESVENFEKTSTKDVVIDAQLREGFLVLRNDFKRVEFILAYLEEDYFKRVFEKAVLTF